MAGAVTVFLYSLTQARLQFTDKAPTIPIELRGLSRESTPLDYLLICLVVVLAATLSAFIGAYAGKRLLKKLTLRFVELTVAAMMVLIGGGLACGVL